MIHPDRSRPPGADEAERRARIREHVRGLLRALKERSPADAAPTTAPPERAG